LIDLYDVTVGIKTFFRTDCLEKCLNALVDLPFKEIIVTDDGIINKEKREIYRKMREKLNIRLIECPFNIGIGWCRKKVFEETTTPYLLILDDDVIAPKNVFLLKKILDHDPKLGAVSGILFENGEFVSRAHNLYLKGRTLFRDISGEFKANTLRNIKYYLFDFVDNSGIFRMRCLEDYCWDKNYVIGSEHLDFFLGHKKLGIWKFAVTPNVVFQHLKGGSKKYYSFRSNKRVLNQSLKYFKNKWKIKKIKKRRYLLGKRMTFDRAKSEILYKVIPPILQEMWLKRQI